MDITKINDKRLQKEFRGITFSGYKKTEVKKQLISCISASKYEESCYWAAEFICSGHYGEIWEIILSYMSKNIHLGNPKLPIYIEIRYNAFRDIVNAGYVDNELKMRNNDKIRKLFAEIFCVLCSSKKRNSFNSIKVSQNDFNLCNLTNRLKAPSLNYGQNIFRSGDPKDLFIAINEFMFNLLRGNTQEVFWWLEWFITYESVCKKNKKKMACVRRDNIPVVSSLQTDIIWILWDGILYCSTKKSNGYIKIIRALLNNYCIRYSSGVKKKRRFMMYFAISILCLPCDLSTNIIDNGEIIEKISSKINIIYKQIKKNEKEPKTGYLFKNLNSGNLEKTVAKLDIMSQINTFLPRKD